VEDAGAARLYRERAAEVRSEAEKMNNPETKQQLLKIADSYERLAKTIDARGRGRAERGFG
jgi:hypothetical protein